MASWVKGVQQTVALFTLLWFFDFVEGSDDFHGTVVLAHVLYRHGDRSPINPFQTDAYKNSWPQGYGQLSTIGMRQQYHLGQYLRQRYMLDHNLLNMTYIRDQIYVRSTDMERTLMSAYCNLAGLYPPTGSQVWYPQIPWQPIPVHTVPRMEDKLLSMGVECPAATQLHKEVQNSPTFIKEAQKHKEFYKYLSKYTGEDIDFTHQKCDTFTCELAHNMTLPDWALKKWDNMNTVVEKSCEIALKSFMFYLGLDYTHTLERLRGGVLLKEMIKNINASIAQGGNQHTKLFMYSAHDTTVAHLLSALQVYNRMTPPYIATVLVELYNASGKYSVQVQYRNDSSREPYILQIPGCTAYCPYDKFLALTFDMVPVDWDAECQGPSHNRHGLLLAVAMTTLLLALLVASVSLFVMHRRNKKLSNEGYKVVPDEITE
ncbi:Prostatic acid phosphatase [Lamellibrachia satsuma]|nr:Prostatic acid phosphatase [Lamellibrachia satsuma]